MSYEMVNCPKCGSLIPVPSNSVKPANDNRPPDVVVRTFKQLNSGKVYAEIAKDYVATRVGRRNFLDVASTRVSEFLYHSGRYRIVTTRSDASVVRVDFKIGPDCLDRVFRPDSTGDIRWLGRLEERIGQNRMFRRPRQDVLERLQYLDLVNRTPLCGKAV